MSNDDKSVSITNNQSPLSGNTPPVFVQEDVLPPMPQAAPVPQQDIVNPSPANTNTGSAAPTDDIVSTVMPAVTTSSTPKKKFAGGKIIATILGLFLLVGGVGTGVYLTSQNQNTQEKAAGGLEGFTCQPGQVDRCLNTNDVGNASWDGFSCVLSVCPNGSTDGVDGCGLGDLGGNYEVGSCTEMLNRIRGFPETQCYQIDTIVSMANNAWCNLSAGQGSVCTGYASNTDTCSVTCNKMYFCNLDGTTGTTESLYAQDSHLECNKPNPVATCEQNLATWRTGDSATTNICYKTEAEAKNDPVCKVVTPTAPPVVSCNSHCDLVNGPANQCGTGLACVSVGNGPVQNLCRNTQCKSSSTCVCPTNSPTASCTSVKTYRTSGDTETPLTATQLSQLKTGDAVDFCVKGTSSDVGFDKARFSINGIFSPEIPIGIPSPKGTCYGYTVPSGGTKTFSVQSQVHHITLGWL